MKPPFHNGWLYQTEGFIELLASYLAPNCSHDLFVSETHLHTHLHTGQGDALRMWNLVIVPVAGVR